VAKRKQLRVLACAALITAYVTARPAPAEACSIAAPAFTFTGSARAKSHDRVTFTVASVQPGPGPSAVALPAPGSEIVVRYWDGDERFIDVGTSYSVTVWGDPQTADYGSGVHTAEDHCGGGGTVLADGGAIDTGNKLFGWPAWTAYPIAALVTTLAALGLVSCRAGDEFALSVASTDP
jgi:hypothetical protein